MVSALLILQTGVHGESGLQQIILQLNRFVWLFFTKKVRHQILRTMRPLRKHFVLAGLITKE